MLKAVNDYQPSALLIFNFDKTRRLLKKVDYDHVFSQAEKIVTPEFIMLYRRNALGSARLGLALSKKMINKAVQRNRLKRVLRESFRKRELPAVDVIFLARNGVSKVESQIIVARLSTAWDKLIDAYGN